LVLLPVHFQIGYYLDESQAWGMDIAELQRAIDEAKKHCIPRAIVVINPGNPTGVENTCFFLNFIAQKNL
jgi:Aspartate/tyrosine/aromatic aminotransferase